jgi:hypothetical protein
LYEIKIMLTVTPTRKWGAEIYTRGGPAGTFRGNCSATHPEPALTWKINTSMRIMPLDEKVLHPTTVLKRSRWASTDGFSNRYSDSPFIIFLHVIDESPAECLFV